MYKAIFFDLDGTLLPMDIDEFMGSYFTALKSFIAANDRDMETFDHGLRQGIHAMSSHDDDRLNADVFWEAFLPHVEGGHDAWNPLLTSFYEKDFGAIGDRVVPNDHAVASVELLRNKGYSLTLATMPMFPQTAVEWRLRWAGIDPGSFDRMTTYENSTSVKPKASYFIENVKAAGVEPHEILMVGNNTREDLACLEVGMDAFLVTDHLLDPEGFDLGEVKHGSFADFAQWAQKLPASDDAFPS